MSSPEEVKLPLASSLQQVVGALLFGAASSLQMTIQNLGLNISNDLIMTIPYVCTVLAVIAVCRNKVIAPSALGVPYRKS